jgi:hypothetical protein
VFKSADDDDDDGVRARMLGALDPFDLDAADDALLRVLSSFAEREAQSAADPNDAVRMALRYALDGSPLDYGVVDPAAAIQLLDWRRSALTHDSIIRSVADLMRDARDRLERASQGSYGMGSAETGQLSRATGELSAA